MIGPTYRVEAQYGLGGLWLVEARGLSAGEARAYIRNSKFWDGTRRRMRREV
jgi:hypothetical protein